MTFEAFVGLAIFYFVLVYIILIVIPGLVDIFPHENRGIKIDFKNHD